MKLLALLIACLAVLPARASEALERQLAGQFRTAHERRDAAALARLVHWQGVDAPTREAVLASFKDDFARRIVRIEFTPAPPAPALQYRRAGQLYRPNLKVERRMVVHFQPDKGSGGAAASTAYLVGREGSAYLIATAAPASPPGRP